MELKCVYRLSNRAYRQIFTVNRALLDLQEPFRAKSKSCKVESNFGSTRNLYLFSTELSLKKVANRFLRSVRSFHGPEILESQQRNQKMMYRNENNAIRSRLNKAMKSIIQPREKFVWCRSKSTVALVCCASIRRISWV